MHRPPGSRLRSMAWLAHELGVSRQMLYAVLSLERRSADLEGRLSEMFPDLPSWPYLGADPTGSVPWKETR